MRSPKGGMRVFRPNNSHDCCNDQNELGNSGLIRRTRIDYLQETLPASPGGNGPASFPLRMGIAFDGAVDRSGSPKSLRIIILQTKGKAQIYGPAPANLFPVADNKAGFIEGVRADSLLSGGIWDGLKRGALGKIIPMGAGFL